jgi:hypothetical protein
LLSISIAFPLGMSDSPAPLHAFEEGLNQAFLVSFGITLITAPAANAG